MVGGPLGGAVVAIAGVAAAAWVDAASFAVVLVVLVAIRRRIVVVATSRRTESVLAAARDGVRICRQTPGLGVALLLAAGAAGFVIPSTSLLVPLLARHNHWSASTAGLMVGAQGLGVIVSALVVARRGGARRPGIAAVGGLATAAIGQTLVAVIPSSGLVVVAAVLIGLGSGTFVANLAPVLLGAVPRTHLARVQSLLSVVQSSALLVTNNLLGAITHWASAPIAMMCCAGGLATCVVVALTRPTLRHLGGPGAAPSDRSDG
jgi:predicted MFS family arabinose efflux permease